MLRKNCKVFRRIRKNYLHQVIKKPVKPKQVSFQTVVKSALYIFLTCQSMSYFFLLKK